MTTIRYVDSVWEQVTASSTTQYTAPANVESAHVIFAQCTNEDASDTTLTVNIVQSGGSVAVTNRYIAGKSIVAGVSEPLDIVGAVLKPGDFISAIAGAADRLNLKIGIKEIYA